jgi:DNA-binding CsgD family transcriptional regulator
LAPLELRDYRLVLDVLEDSGGARSRPEFQQELLDGLARHLGFRNAVFYVADTPAKSPAGLILTDPAPVSTGRSTALVPDYIGEYHASDPFPAYFRGKSPRALSPALELDFAASRGCRYVDKLLYCHRIWTQVNIPIPSRSGIAGLVLMDGEAAAYGPRDLARAAALAPHIGNLLALHGAAGFLAAPAAVADKLTARQAQVASMAANGLTNQQIAQALFITLDTVKKHLTSAYATLGCKSRTQLSLLWRASQRVTRDRPQTGNFSGGT